MPPPPPDFLLLGPKGKRGSRGRCAEVLYSEHLVLPGEQRVPSVDANAGSGQMLSEVKCSGVLLPLCFVRDEDRPVT